MVFFLLGGDNFCLEMVKTNCFGGVYCYEFIVIYLYMYIYIYSIEF